MDRVVSFVPREVEAKFVASIRGNRQSDPASKLSLRTPAGSDSFPAFFQNIGGLMDSISQGGSLTDSEAVPVQPGIDPAFVKGPRPRPRATGLDELPVCGRVGIVDGHLPVLVETEGGHRVRVVTDRHWRRKRLDVSSRTRYPHGINQPGEGRLVL